MRPYIPYLDTNAMEWAHPVPSVYSKVLSVDPENGARTALQRLVPSKGYQAPSVPHYHHSAEEILVVKGRLSFDSKNYLGAKDYCYHPPLTVHGFKSDVPVETWFLSRHSKKMCTHEVPKPKVRKYYALNGKPPRRGWESIAGAAETGWDDGVRALSEDPKTHEGSRFMKFNGKAVDLDVPKDFYQEFFVLGGSLTTKSGKVYGRGAYSFVPPGKRRPNFVEARRALVYVNYGPA
jgi:hypothetical protein